MMLNNTINSLGKKKNFLENETLLKGFFLIAFKNSNHPMGIDLVGTSTDLRTLIVYNVDNSFLKYEVDFKYPYTKKICNIVPADYDCSGNISYLLVSREGEGYSNSILFKYMEHLLLLENTRAVPMLLFCKGYRPALLMHTDEGNYILKFKKGDVFEKEFINIPNLHHLHSSCFADVDGDRVPELIFETKHLQKRFIEVFSYANNVFTKLEEYPIPNIIGPIQFSDLNRSGLVDLIFASKEGGKSYLNIIFNTGFKGDRFGETSLQKIEVCQGLIGFEVLTENETFNMPGGILIADILCNSVPQIILAVKNKRYGLIRYIWIRNLGDRKFEIDYEAFRDLPDQKIVSLCFADVKNLGYQTLLLNHYKDGDYRLSLYKNYPVTLKNKYYVKILTTHGGDLRKGSGLSIPGVSYRYKKTEIGETYIGSQLTQSTFPHFHLPYLFVGLGTFPYMLQLESIGIPSYGEKIFKYPQKIAPNSLMVLYSESTAVRVYFGSDVYIKIRSVLFMHIFFVAVNLLIIFILSRINKRKQSKIRRGELFFNFKTL